MRNVKLLLEKILAVLKLANNEQIIKTKNSILQNETKRKVYELCDGKHTVKDMVAALGTTQPNVSYHLSSISPLPVRPKRPFQKEMAYVSSVTMQSNHSGWAASILLCPVQGATVNWPNI
jgi:DNA-binding transcriptional ArsR family regulator